MARVKVARTEPGNELHELEYGGEVYRLVPVLDLAAVEAVEAQLVGAFFRAIVVEEDQKRFWKAVNVAADGEALADAVVDEIYGLGSTGESAASGDS